MDYQQIEGIQLPMTKDQQNSAFIKAYIRI